MTALMRNPLELPRVGVNASVRGYMIRTAITTSDATAMMMSPNFRFVHLLF